MPVGADIDAARVVYSRSGIGERVGMGERVALVVVDLQRGFTDPACRVGSDLTEVVAANARLLTAMRALQLPVAYTVIGYQPGEAARTVWLRKMPGLAELVEGSHWCEVDERLARAADEPVWTKRAASAFFGTPLLSFLVGGGVDTLIVTGCVTSGCIRATVVDSVSCGFRTIVPIECIGDRAEGPHRWNIFDMDSKYADVESLDDVIASLNDAVVPRPGAAGSSARGSAAAL